MAEQGTLNFIAGNPAGVLRLLRENGFTLDVTGSLENWRQADVVCGEASLTLRLKIKLSDPAYFRRHLPLLIGSIEAIPAQDIGRKTALLALSREVTGSIGLTAFPHFGANDRMAAAIKLAGQAVGGFIAVEGGVFDTEFRALLNIDGTSDPAARLPAMPSRDMAAVTGDEAFYSDAVPSPTPTRVAERMFIMLAVGYRAMIEKETSPQATRKLRRLGEWFWNLNVTEELEAIERRALDCELGRMPAMLSERLAMSFEAITVLAWALRLADLPAHDAPTNPRLICTALGLFNADARFVIDSADIRNAHELREAADRILAVHWRLNQFDRDAAPLDMAGMAADAWFGDMDSGKLALIDNDLAIANQRVADIGDNVRERCRQITIERHRAINWLLGHHPLLSRVETAT